MGTSSLPQHTPPAFHTALRRPFRAAGAAAAARRTPTVTLNACLSAARARRIVRPCLRILCVSLGGGISCFSAGHGIFSGGYGALTRSLCVGLVTCCDNAPSRTNVATTRSRLSTTRTFCLTPPPSRLCGGNRISRLPHRCCIFTAKLVAFILCALHRLYWFAAISLPSLKICALAPPLR